MSGIDGFMQAVHQVLSDTAFQFFVSTTLSGVSIILAQGSGDRKRGSILKKSGPDAGVASL